MRDCLFSFLILLQIISSTDLISSFKKQERLKKFWAQLSRGRWCSGITPAQHAGGPGFNPVHASLVLLSPVWFCSGSALCHSRFIKFGTRSPDVVLVRFRGSWSAHIGDTLGYYNVEYTTICFMMVQIDVRSPFRGRALRESALSGRARRRAHPGIYMEHHEYRHTRYIQIL